MSKTRIGSPFRTGAHSRGPALAFAWLAMAAMPALGQDAADTLHVPLHAISTGKGGCTLSRIDKLTSDTRTLRLVIQVEDSGSSSKLAAPGIDLIFAVNGEIQTVLQSKSTSNAVDREFGALAGKTLDVRAVPGERAVCSVTLPAKPAAQTSLLSIASGVEFSSANYFAAASARVPVTAAWSVPLTGRGPAAPFRLSLTILVEATSLAQQRVFFKCDSVTARGLGTPPPAFPSSVAPCPGGTISQFGADSFHATLLAPVLDRSQLDSTPGTMGIWRGTALLRGEFRLWRNGGVYAGPAILIGGESNPTDPALETAGFVSRFGASLRQEDADHTERFSLLATWGKSDLFPVNVVQTKAPSGATPGASQQIPQGVRRVGGWFLRLQAQPLDGWVIRALIQTENGGADTATLAVLKVVDLGKLFEAIGGSSKATKTAL